MRRRRAVVPKVGLSYRDISTWISLWISSETSPKVANDFLPLVDQREAFQSVRIPPDRNLCLFIRRIKRRTKGNSGCGKQSKYRSWRKVWSRFISVSAEDHCKPHQRDISSVKKKTKKTKVTSTVGDFIKNSYVWIALGLRCQPSSGGRREKGWLVRLTMLRLCT